MTQSPDQSSGLPQFENPETDRALEISVDVGETAP
jgi:hypothetical protein